MDSVFFDIIPNLYYEWNKFNFKLDLWRIIPFNNKL